jgi:hypothetical protein
MVKEKIHFTELGPINTNRTSRLEKNKIQKYKEIL